MKLLDQLNVSKFTVTLSLIAFLIVLLVLLLQVGVTSALIFSLLPLIIGGLLLYLKKPVLIFYSLFIVNYIIMGLTRYVKGLPGGILVDAFLALGFLFVIIRKRDRYFDSIQVLRPITVLTFIWLIYCVLLLFNPHSKLVNWSTGIRGMAAYMFLFPLLVILLVRRFSAMKKVVMLWSFLTLLAVLKALIQKFFGFDIFEKYWLYVDGGSVTHIIYSGIRYFSFFTDAANFGCGMGLSMVVFSILFLFERNTYLKLYLLLVTVAAAYGMLISGTRAAMAIPFVSYSVAIVLSKQWRILIPGILFIALLFVFFKFTTLGASNAEIRRMRTVFQSSKDASYLVRVENQKKMKQFMDHYPFGVGIGNSKRSEVGDVMYQLPTDTTLVFIWVETGIVGLTLYLFILFVLIAKGSWEILFRIQDRELRGFLIAFLSGVVGMLIAAYGNEVFQQFPNGPIVYICLAFVALGKYYDNKLLLQSNA